MPVFSTSTEARRYIIECIESGDVTDAEAEYDIDEIYDAVAYGTTICPSGSVQSDYRVLVTDEPDEFWTAVAENACNA